MRKSDFLDQLRLEVGLAYDYATSKEDFYKRVLNRLYEMANKRCNISVYMPLPNGTLNRIYLLGKPHEFGMGFIGLSKLNLSVLLTKETEQAILSPVFEDNKLSYVILMNVSAISYKISEPDMVFVNELVRFIGAKSVTFTNHDKDE